MNLLKMFRPLGAVLRDSTKLLFADRYLLYTNTFLSFSLSGVADVLQQYSNAKWQGAVFKWDYQRTRKMAVTGLVLGPFIHYWYMYLDKLMPGRSLKILAKKLAVDQIVFSPFYMVLFLGTIAIQEQQSLQELKEEVIDTGTNIIMVELFLYTPAQAFNFHFLSLKFRILFDGVISLIMDAVCSYLRFDHRPCKTKNQNAEGEDKSSAERTEELHSKSIQNYTETERKNEHFHLSTPAFLLHNSSLDMNRSSGCEGFFSQTDATVKCGNMLSSPECSVSENYLYNFMIF